VVAHDSSADNGSEVRDKKSNVQEGKSVVNGEKGHASQDEQSESIVPCT
jgi:hypothetical protein